MRALCQKPKAFIPERKEERFQTDLAIRFEGGEGVAHNVSANGIYFTTDAAFRVGQPVKLTFEFSSPGGPIAANCVARVVRLEERGARRGVGASIGSFEMRRVAPGKSSKVMKGPDNEYGPSQASALDGGFRSAMAGASTAKARRRSPA